MDRVRLSTYERDALRVGQLLEVDLADKRLELLREVLPNLRQWRSWPAARGAGGDERGEATAAMETPADTIVVGRSKGNKNALKLIAKRQKPYPARGDQYVGSGEPKR